MFQWKFPTVYYFGQEFLICLTCIPSFQGARRIVPEWVGLDNEARHFTAQILGDNLESPEATSPPSETPKPDDKDTDQNVKDEL